MGYLLSFEVSVRDGPVRTILTRESSVTIGRGRRAVLQSQDGGLEDLHSVVMQRDDGTMVLLNYSRGPGTLLNGESTESAVIREGDEIRCGDTTIRLVERLEPDAMRREASPRTAIRDFLQWAVKSRLMRR